MDFIKRNWWWILGGGAVLYLMTKAKSATAAPGAAAGAAAVPVSQSVTNILPTDLQDLLQQRAKPGTEIDWEHTGVYADGSAGFAWTGSNGVGSTFYPGGVAALRQAIADKRLDPQAFDGFGFGFGFGFRG